MLGFSIDEQQQLAISNQQMAKAKSGNLAVAALMKEAGS
jgi:hypothetical protein